MIDHLNSQLQVFKQFSIALKEVCRIFDKDSLKNDRGARDLVNKFLLETYQCFNKTIENIEDSLPFMSNRPDYRSMEETVEELKDFLETYKDIFKAAGVVDEEEIIKRTEKLSKIKPRLKS